MAAGQQKKRSNSASVIRFNLHEQHRVKKKKKLELSNNTLIMRSHISLEWDDSQRRPVAKREQVGITWRDMAPFVDFIPQPHSGLADVFSVPQEIFGLENITEVLSYEVWETFLSESERKFLIQFLPCGIDAGPVLQSLFMGENLHFGNPFCKWGTSLCAGNLHPDAVLRRNQHLKANKRSYYSELKQYHTEIIESLLKWKERWTSCKNPDKDIVEKMWRKGITKPNCGSPSIVSEKAKVVPSSEQEKRHNICIHYGDSTEYMSYFKISRKQLELIKNIKHSGDGIQSKSLKRVLGDIKDFHVWPYETFEEDERKRLHEHWLQLASKDLPDAFEHSRKQKSLREQWRRSLEQELAEKRKLIMEKDEEKENPKSLFLEQVDNGESEHLPTSGVQDQGDVDSACNSTDSHHLERIPSLNSDVYDQGDVNLAPSSTDSHHLKRIPSLNRDLQDQGDVNSAPNTTDSHHLERVPSLDSHQELSQIVMDRGNQDILKPADTYPTLSQFLGLVTPAMDVVEPKASHSSDGCHLERVPSLNSDQELCPMVLDQERNQDILDQADNPTVSSQVLGNVNPTKDLMEPKVYTSSANDIWPAVGIRGSYYHPTSESHGYTSAGELSLGQSQPMKQHPVHFIGLETDIPDQTGPESETSAFHTDSGASMFNSYANQDRNVLLSPFSKGQGVLPSYPQEHLHSLKQSGFQFLVANDSSQQSSQFSHQFQGQQQGLLEQRHAREKELYMHQMMSKNIYSNSRYPSRGQFSSVDSQDWAAFQSPVYGGLLGHSWFPGEYRTRNGLSNVESSGTVGPCLGDGGNADGSLFSVLSECKQLPSHLSYDPTSSVRIAPAGNFVGGGVSNNDGIYAYAPHQVNNASGRDAAMMMSNLSWANVPHQNSGLQDSVGKTFLRSWNQ